LADNRKISSIRNEKVVRRGNLFDIIGNVVFHDIKTLCYGCACRARMCQGTFHVFSEKDFEIDNKGKAQQKLSVLPYLSDLLYHNCMIGNFINSGIYIRADYFVGNTKAVLSVGFRTGKSIDFPVTLYNEDVRKLSHPTNKVLAIFAKGYQDRDYTECTYLSKGQEICKLPISEEVKKLIRIEESV